MYGARKLWRQLKREAFGLARCTVERLTDVQSLQGAVRGKACKTTIPDKVIHRRGPWRHRDAVEYATLEWVDWFNNQRLLEPICNVPPAEFEAAYYRQQDESGHHG